MTDVFETLVRRMHEQTASFGPEEFLMRGVWKVELGFKPNPAERVFSYTFWLAMTRGQGCCYCTGDDPRGRELVGSDARELVREQTCISIAALDSLYASLPKRPAAVHEFEGNPVDKTPVRTGIILEEARRLLAMAGVTGRCPKVVNVGVVGNVIRALKNDGCEVLASDLEPEMVGTTVHGTLVQGGTETFDLVRDADLAIVTGMTIATDSLGLIVEEARTHDTRLLIFAETGANFGQEYCRTFGVDTVVAEPFPFYIFQGKSRVEVFRREP